MEECSNWSARKKNAKKLWRASLFVGTLWSVPDSPLVDFHYDSSCPWQSVLLLMPHICHHHHYRADIMEPHPSICEHNCFLSAGRLWRLVHHSLQSVLQQLTCSTSWTSWPGKNKLCPRHKEWCRKRSMAGTWLTLHLQLLCKSHSKISTFQFFLLPVNTVQRKVSLYIRELVLYISEDGLMCYVLIKNKDIRHFSGLKFDYWPFFTFS